MRCTREDRYGTYPPLAFTAMAGVFPGSSNLEAFWERIVNARVAPQTSLESRWTIPRAAYFDPTPGKPDRICLDKAFCLPEENHTRGRQIGYASQTVATLILNAGKPSPLDLSQVGLVLGTSWSDQGHFLQDIDCFFGEQAPSPASDTPRHSPDEQLTVIRDRHKLGGPCLSVDTACASSLYAIEMAANLIRSGQTRGVIVLGLSIILPPFMMAAFSQLMALPPSGKCLPFSKDACGMVPGEGAGAVLLEPLEDALRDDRPILGILRSVGLSSDGSEGAIFAPGRTGQLLAYERAYRDLDPAHVDYIEAHGTATMVGDQTEIASLSAFFGDRLAPGTRIPVGSVKGIIGHTLAAAGMASLIKGLMMLAKGTVPPHIPVLPHPDLEASCLELPSRGSPLQERTRPNRIGISSFGFGGANAHLVLESFSRKPSIHTLKGLGREAPPVRMAVVDLEAAFGRMVCADQFKKSLEAEDLAFGPFPEGRFRHPFVGNARGLFFPEKLEIDAQGLRLGPRLLARIDPFQTLTAYLVNRLVQRHPDIGKSDDTAVLFCNNMGGSKAYQLTRRNYARYTLPPSDANRPQATSIEDIASALGCMLSGYCALHLDFRGFHQTLSGMPGLFWTALLSAPYLLRHHCRHLILGAGNIFKTPLDFRHPGIAEGSAGTPLAEGFAAFLLKDLEQARADGDHILAEILAMVPGHEGQTFNEACSEAGVAPQTVDIREQCILAGHDNPETSRGTPEPLAWFLAEAAGIGALSAALLKGGTVAAVEVLSHSERLLTLFLSKENDLQKSSESAGLPITLDFRDSILAQHATHGEPTSPVPPPQPPVAHTGSATTEELLLWQSSTAEALGRYFQLQKKILESAAGNISPPPDAEEAERDAPGTTVARRRERNIVLDLNAIQETGARMTAPLKVDEAHPYFFDHPLDHVPGILIIEGVLQLFEQWTLRCRPSPQSPRLLLREMEIMFTRWCEKETPVTLHLEQSDRATPDTLHLTCSVEQAGEIIGTIHLVSAPVPADIPLHSRTNTEPVLPCPQPSMLHKDRAENVLVSHLDTGGACSFVDTLPPPPGHLLDDGDPGFFSLLYLLEASRQCGLLIIHQLGEVPMDMPMVLLRMKLSVDRPVRRTESLRISVRPEARSSFTPNMIGTMTLELSASGNSIGKASIAALIADSETYRSQRWKETEPAN